MRRLIVLATLLSLVPVVSAQATTVHHRKHAVAPKHHRSSQKPAEKPQTRLPVPPDAYRA